MSLLPLQCFKNEATTKRNNRPKQTQGERFDGLAAFIEILIIDPQVDMNVIINRGADISA